MEKMLDGEDESTYTHTHPGLPAHVSEERRDSSAPLYVPVEGNLRAILFLRSKSLAAASG